MSTTTQPPFPLTLGLESSHALITGGTGLIGKVVVQAFLAAGANVTILDITPTCPFSPTDPHIVFQQADITDAAQMDRAFAAAEAKFGPVEVCVALASLDLCVLQQTESLADADPGEWRRVFDVNVNGTFMTCQRWLRSIRKAAADPGRAALLKNPSLIIMGSESGRFGVRTMAAYAAGKSAVQGGLLLSLAQDAPRLFPRARVNAIAPGVVDTERLGEERARFGEEWYWKIWDATVPMAKPIPPEDVARTILFLASERYSGSVHGQVIPVDAGRAGSLVWTREELAQRS